MDSITLSLGILCIALAGVTWHAWRLGNERRDVALLGATSGALGLGTAIAAFV